MYLDFFRSFGLRENPFQQNPDPSYLFANQRIQSALDDLAAAIQARKGLLLVIGEVGTGKTTLIRRLMYLLKQQRTPTAFIFNPHLEPNELFALMLADFGIPFDVRLHGNVRPRLHQWLVEQHQRGKNAVLILDEAQGLPSHVLEEVRLLLNQETRGEKLLQVVVCGQPEFEEKLRRHDLRQIRQRICLRCETKPLTREEAHTYIQKRLNTAGAAGEKVFAPEAIDAVHFYARGIPRVMNLLCEHALIQAYREALRPVTASVVDDVARQLQFDDVRPVAGCSSINQFLQSDPTEWLSTSNEVPDALPARAAMASFVTVVSEEPTGDSALDLPAGNSVLGESLVSEPESQGSSIFGTKNSAESSKTTALKAAGPARQDERRNKVSRIGSALRGQALAVAKRLASAARTTSKNLLSLVSSLSTSRALGSFPFKLSSPNWGKHFGSMIRWLQQPMPTVKVSRRTRD
jgi:general secretion pathway protein A